MKPTLQTSLYQVNSAGHLAMVEEYDPTTMVVRELTPDMTLSRKQLSMLKGAENYPIEYDTDCPETTPQMAEAFKKAAAVRNKKKAALKNK